MVFAECTPVSKQYFESLQELVTLRLGLTAIPVPSKAAMVEIVVQMVSEM